MTVEQLPTLNAVLNGTSACFVLVGFAFVRAGRIAAHRACMLLAVLTSILFLSSYLVYHAEVGSVVANGPVGSSVGLLRRDRWAGSCCPAHRGAGGGHPCATNPTRTP